MAKKWKNLLEEQTLKIEEAVKKCMMSADGFENLSELRGLLEEQKSIQKRWRKRLSKNRLLATDLARSIVRLDALIKTIEFGNQGLYHEVDESLEKITALIASSSDTEANDKDIQIAQDMIALFSLLFATTPDDNSLFNQLKKSSDAQQCYYYLKRIVTIKNLVNALPDDYKFKSLLLNGIHDNCNQKWIDEFENGVYEPSDFHKFIKEHDGENILNTVEVKTWGTKREISSGLRHVVHKQLVGEDVGHSSLTIRINADENGRELIQKYCLFEYGTVKIPYELKKYGRQAVYEIYWSYWPSVDESELFTLNTPKEDIESERDNISVTYAKKMRAEMPSELRELSFLQRNRLGKKVDFSPVAVKNMSSVETDVKRQEYLNLKLKKYQLNEEIESLGVLFSNYLDKDTEGFPLILKERPIKTTSNFFILLKRFKTQLPATIPVSEILINKSISPEDAMALGNAVQALAKEKAAIANQLKEDIKKCANKVQTNRELIKSLKSRIKSHRTEIANFTDNLKISNIVRTFLETIMADPNSHYPIALDEKMATDIARYNNVFNQYISRNRNLAKTVAESKELSAVNIKKLHYRFCKYEKKANNVLLQLKEDMCALQSANRNVINTRLTTIQVEINELDSVISTLLPDDDGANFDAIQRYKESKKALQEEYIRLKLDTHRTVEDLVSKNIERGLPTHNITLTGFNIESMLKKASELVDAKRKFNLYEENCSTTCMKILHAGANVPLKTVFKWSEKEPGETVASNTFLTNPQAVYSAARIAQDYSLGKKEAIHYVDHQGKTKVDRKYYRHLNELASLDDQKLLKKISTFRERIKLFFRFIPYLLSLIKDWWPKADVKPEKKSDSFLSKLNRAIKNPETNSYDYIQASSALLAIHAMVNKLKSNPTAIPFFDEQTLTLVDHFILNLEAKNNKTPAEELVLTHYQAIIKERNERVHGIERALFANKNPVIELRERAFNPECLEWQVTKEEEIQHKLELFTKAYMQLRQQKSLTSLRSNFIRELKRYDTNEAKLEAILDHMFFKPKSRTATAWEQVIHEAVEETERIPRGHAG